MSKIYENAKEIYASFGIDTDKMIEEVRKIPVSMHCWQGDDVKGFENPNGTLTGGIQTTGNYPGAATNIEQLRADFEKACSLIPGTKRISLHAIYLDSQGEKVERNEIQPKHFDSWIDWAKKHDLGIDFNPTCFSHPLSGDGFTLSHPNEEIRKFWIEHCIASRKIAAYIGEKLGNTVATNYWVPDGFKDIPVDRMGARERLIDSYDKIFADYIDPKYNLDSLEGKVFGIGAESCTIGSNDFYLAYAIKNNKLLTLDAGHFHPTEMISDKISTALLFAPGLLLHVSRPVRWDSDHVVIFDDELRAIAEEIVRSGMIDKVHIGLDFFDASINRIAAWVIGTRNMQKALLYAKLQPAEKLKEFEITGDYTSRLAYLEAFKTLPFAAVWDHYCELENVPTGLAWLDDVKKYEADVLSKR